MTRRKERLARPHLQLILTNNNLQHEHVIVHPRVTRRHPDLTIDDVITAWRMAFASRYRDDGTRVAIGQDSHGRLLELVSKSRPDGRWLIYHAMTPPTAAVLKELRVLRREK